jgi:hypothetical protein
MTAYDYDDFPHRLRAEVPGFDRVFDEHVRDNGEILTHLLLGDFVRFLSDQVRAHGAESAALPTALELIERAIDSPDPKLQELIVVSFLENLEPDDPSFVQIRSHFGARLEQEYRKYRAALGDV